VKLNSIFAGKRWGPRDGNPVIFLHGWQENAAAFDRLIPLLSPELNLNIVCLDMAGCGLSTHYPPGFSYHEMDSFLMLHRVRHHFNWSKFALVGHSLGGGLSQLFAGTFPELVVSVAVIDIMRPVFRPVETYPTRLRKSVESFLDWEYLLTDKEVITPVYSWQEARDRLVKAASSLTPESADVLLSRGLRPAVKPDGTEGYVYRRDPRLKISSFLNLTSEHLEAFLARIQCPLMIIKGAQGPKYEGPEVHVKVREFFEKTLDDFRYVQVEGNHHVHLNNPERVAAPLNEFFQHVLTVSGGWGTKSKL
jgi:pimeloyl-ACP methyl ester carboxylesterase